MSARLLRAKKYVKEKSTVRPTASTLAGHKVKRDKGVYPDWCPKSFHSCYFWQSLFWRAYGALTSPRAKLPQAKVHCHLRETRFKEEGFLFYETKPHRAKADLNHYVAENGLELLSL